MKFTGLIGAAISFSYLPFFLRHEFQPVTQKHIEIEKSSWLRRNDRYDNVIVGGGGGEWKK